MGLIDSLRPCARLGSGNILDTLCESPSCSRRFLIITDSIAKTCYSGFNLSGTAGKRNPVLLPPKNLVKADADSRRRSQKGSNLARSVHHNSKWHTCVQVRMKVFTV